jgi:hypothetical protein
VPHAHGSNAGELRSSAARTSESGVSNLFIAVLAGAVGMGYFVYGRRQARAVPMIAGIVLCVYPYFVDSLLWLSIIGIALAAAPFLVDF